MYMKKHIFQDIYYANDETINLKGGLNGYTHKDGESYGLAANNIVQ